MSLHKATEIIKKFFIFSGIGIGSVIAIILLFRIGVFIKNIAVPPKITPPNHSFDILPTVQFPQKDINNNFTYILNTLSGRLPADFPDRLHVYELIKEAPNLLNLNKAKTKAQALGFSDPQGGVLPETPLGNGVYQWSELTGINRKFKLNIVTFNFSLTSNYLASLTVLGAQNLNDENNAIQTAQGFLTNIGLFPADIDLAKTQTPKKDQNLNTYPQLFTVRNGSLFPTTSLSNAKVIRVDLYQKDIEYDLDTGRKNADKIKLKLPILYPDPPHSTMSFWIASGQSMAEVNAAEFVHREIASPSAGLSATYPIKTADAAFEELKNGKAYIASYDGSENEILISNVFLAYYLGGEDQQYLMPIVVFEGQNGFLAYISAITEEWVK